LVRGKTNDDGISHLFFSKNNFCWSSTFDLSKARSKLPEESKGIGTLSGSKAETNDDAASTSRSKSIQPNNLDLAFDKSNVDDQQKLFLLLSGTPTLFPNELLLFIL
jgi:hypothetical protein